MVKAVHFKHRIPTADMVSVDPMLAASYPTPSVISGPIPQPQPQQPQMPPPSGFMDKVDTAVNITNTAAGIAGFAMIPAMVLGTPVPWMMRTAGKVPGLGALSRGGDSLQKNVQKISGSKTFHNITQGAFVVNSAAGIYGVARDSAHQLEALKQMDAELTGRDPKDISTSEVMFGSVPPAVASARKTLLATEAAHGISHAVSLVANYKMLRGTAGKFLSHGLGNMATFFLPDMIARAVDGYTGPSMLPQYKGMSDAFKAGEQLSPQAYGQLLMLASDELKSRGSVGEQFAMKLGEQYASEHKSPAQVMNEIHDGGMKKRIAAITQAAASAKPLHVDMAANRAATIAQQPVVGKHTQQVVSKAQLAAMQPPTNQLQ